MRIGVLAIQGSVKEHSIALKKACERLGVADFEVVEIRVPADMVSDDGSLHIQGIVLPGGESTAQSKLLKKYGLHSILKNAITQGLPAFGTCAGAILLSKKVIGHAKAQTDTDLPETLACMDIEADRNAYGSQIDSFEEALEITLSSGEKRTIEAVFIRAPKLKPLSDTVEVLALHNNHPVALKQNNMLAISFHPELTQNTLIHEYFLKMCGA